VNAGAYLFLGDKVGENLWFVVVVKKDENEWD
jgi:hypothetical protein